MRTHFTNAITLGCLCLLAAPGGAAAAPQRTIADAMKRQDTEAMRTLIREHADVNLPEPDGATALHWAAYWDDSDSADRLIQAGADVNAANENAVTALSLACTNGSAAMVGTLLKAGAKPDAALPSGETMPSPVTTTLRLDKLRPPGWANGRESGHRPPWRWIRSQLRPGCDAR